MSVHRWNRGCERIGFAFFKPIIYQSCPPRFHPKSYSLAGTAAEWQGWRGKAGLRSVVSGREIMSLFKDRKFSFARAWKIDFRTLSNALFASSCVRKQPDFILESILLSKYHEYSDNKRHNRTKILWSSFHYLPKF